jgi:hypothetical protein
MLDCFLECFWPCHNVPTLAEHHGLVKYILTVRGKSPKNSCGSITYGQNLGNKELRL